MTGQDYLDSKLQGGACRIGQVQISASHHLCHVEDCGREDLHVMRDPHDALEVAKYDDAGKYRPLKTAPNLRHGWRMELPDRSAVLLALNFLYPAGVGMACAFRELRSVNLRDMLARQSGMYAVVRKLSDDRASEVIADLCNAGCLRRRLWSIDDAHEESRPVEDDGAVIPLWCAEACNFFVAAGRKVLKGDGAH